jgi:hypothetical protein
VLARDELWKCRCGRCSSTDPGVSGARLDPRRTAPSDEAEQRPTRGARTCWLLPTDAGVSARTQLTARSGRASVVSPNGVEALASPGPSGSLVTLPLGVVVAVDQSRSPALADIIGARRMRTAVMISSDRSPAGRWKSCRGRVTKLALDDVQRHALAREFQRVGVAS